MRSRRGDRPVELTKTEFDLLELCCATRAWCSPARDLRAGLGLRLRPASNSLEVYVGYLRRKTEAGGEPRTDPYGPRCRLHLEGGLVTFRGRVALVSAAAVAVTVVVCRQRSTCWLEPSFADRSIVSYQPRGGAAGPNIARPDPGRITCGHPVATEGRGLVGHRASGHSSGEMLATDDPTGNADQRTDTSSGCRYGTRVLRRRRREGLPPPGPHEPRRRWPGDHGRKADGRHHAALSRLRWVLVIVTIGGSRRPVDWGSSSPDRPSSGRTPDGHGRARDEDRRITSRIDIEGDDEIGRLAASFNMMLRALESSIGAQKQLVADASHELRPRSRPCGPTSRC